MSKELILKIRGGYALEIDDDMEDDEIEEYVEEVYQNLDLSDVTFEFDGYEVWE